MASFFGGTLFGGEFFDGTPPTPTTGPFFDGKYFNGGFFDGGPLPYTGVVGGGGTGFEKQARVVPQGPRTYKEKYRRDARTLREEKIVIEFVTRFVSEYL